MRGMVIPLLVVAATLFPCEATDEDPRAPAVPLESSTVDLAREADRRDRLERFHRLIRPQPGESLWTRIPWLTRLDDARARAAREDKPLFVWRAGGGAVLGRA
jgi:hypothetical protein